MGAVFLHDIGAGQVRRVLESYKSGRVRHWVGVDSTGKPKFRSLGRQRSAASVNRLKATLSALYRFAAKKGYTTRNPARQVTGETENNRRVRYLSDDERTRLLAACRKSKWPKLYLLVLAALMTGARKGELKGLRWEQIDFPNRSVELIQTKNGERRVLSFPVPVVEELMRFRCQDGLVFGSERRTDVPFDEKKVWYVALGEAGVEDFRFHDLRHSAASYLAMGGASLLEIAEVLGHRNLQTTKRYAHLSIQHKQQLTDRLLGDLC